MIRDPSDVTFLLELRLHTLIITVLAELEHLQERQLPLLRPLLPEDGTDLIHSGTKLVDHGLHHLSGPLRILLHQKLHALQLIDGSVDIVSQLIVKGLRQICTFLQDLILRQKGASPQFLPGCQLTLPHILLHALFVGCVFLRALPVLPHHIVMLHIEESKEQHQDQPYGKALRQLRKNTYEGKEEPPEIHFRIQGEEFVPREESQDPEVLSLQGHEHRPYQHASGRQDPLYPDREHFLNRHQSDIKRNKQEYPKGYPCCFQLIHQAARGKRHKERQPDEHEIIVSHPFIHYS